VADRAGGLAREALAASHVVVEVRLVRAGLDELAALLRRLRILAGLVERPHRIPQLGRKTLDRLGQADPAVTAGVVARLGRRRERRVGERADRDDDQVRLGGLCIEDLRTAVRAEMEDVLLPVRLVRDPRVVIEATGDLYLVRLEPGLHSEGASGPALAGKAVADGDRKRIARNLQLELAAVAGGFARGHGRRPGVYHGATVMPPHSSGSTSRTVCVSSQR
jgi:hypothetical protein